MAELRHLDEHPADIVHCTSANQPPITGSLICFFCCFYLFFTVGVAERDFGEVLVLASGSGAFGWSPIKRLSGQILNAGHFWQPATMAIGQIVTGIPFW